MFFYFIYIFIILFILFIHTFIINHKINNIEITKNAIQSLFN